MVLWAEQKIAKAKGILLQFDANASSSLSQSITFTQPIIRNGSIIININANDYYKFVDEGVKGIGNTSFKSAKTDKYDIKNKGYKTTRSSFREAITTGKYRFKTPYVGRKMVQSISDWITDKPILIRANKSESSKQSVIPRKETLAYAIAKSIKRTGIGKTMFWSNTFDDDSFTELSILIEQELGGIYKVQFSI